MKNVIALALCLVSSAAFAWTEVECTGKTGEKSISLEVEQPFSRGSVFKDMVVSVTEEGAQQDFNYVVTSRQSAGFKTISYTGGGVRLEVDLWPDQVPHWGTSYRATLNSSDVANTTVSGLQCRFPHNF